MTVLDCFKPLIGFSIGLVSFVLVAGVINKVFFEKSPEQLVQEKCTEIAKFTGVTPTQMKAVIDGKTYTCN